MSEVLRLVQTTSTMSNTTSSTMSKTSNDSNFIQPAPRMAPIGSSRFLEHMDEAMRDPRNDPRMAGVFAGPASAPQRTQQPRRVRDRMVMSAVRRSPCPDAEETEATHKQSRRNCNPLSLIEACSMVPSFFTWRRSSPPTAPEASNSSQVDIELTELPQIIVTPPSCHVRSSNTLRSSRRQDSVVAGAANWELGHHPGGEADEYYLGEEQRPRVMLDTHPIILAEYAAWQEQRMMGAFLSSPSVPSGGVVVEDIHSDVPSSPEHEEPTPPVHFAHVLDDTPLFQPRPRHPTAAILYQVWREVEVEVQVEEKDCADGEMEMISLPTVDALREEYGLEVSVQAGGCEGARNEAVRFHSFYTRWTGLQF